MDVGKKLKTINITKQRGANLVKWIAANKDEIDFDDFLEILKDERFGDSTLRDQYETYVNNPQGSTKNVNARTGLEEKFKKLMSFIEQKLKEPKPTKRMKEKSDFDYNKLSTKQKERFDRFVKLIMDRVEANKSGTETNINPFVLTGQKVNQGGKSKPGTKYNQGDVAEEARRRLLAENKAKIVEASNPIGTAEKLNEILNSELDDEDKKEAMTEILEVAKDKAEKKKRELEQISTPEEIQDLRDSDISMVNALEFFVKAALTAEKGGDIAGKIPELLGKLKDIFKDPATRELAGKVSALGSAVAANVAGGSDISGAIAKPNVMMAGYDVLKATARAPKQAGIIVGTLGMAGLVYNYRDEIFDYFTDKVKQALGLISFLSGWTADQVKEYAEMAMIQITNLTAEEFKNTTGGKVFEEVLSRVNSAEITQEAEKVGNSTETKLLLEGMERLPVETLKSIENGTLNSSNFVETMYNNSELRREMGNALLGVEKFDLLANKPHTDVSYSDFPGFSASLIRHMLSEAKNYQIPVPFLKPYNVRPELIETMSVIPPVFQTLGKSPAIVVPSNIKTFPRAEGMLAPPAIPTVAEINKLNPLLRELPPLPTPISYVPISQINNNYTQNTLPNIMSFETPFKTYEDLPEYLKVLITREEFNAAITNEGNINKLILRKQKNYIDNKNGLLATRLAKVPAERIAVKKEGRYLRSFPIAVPNSTPMYFKPDEQNMIGTNTALAKPPKKLVQIEFGKGRKYENQELIGTETRLIKKVKKIPLY